MPLGDATKKLLMNIKSDHQVLHEETDTKGTFYIEKDGKRLAESTYSKAGKDKIIIDHTDVDKSLRGTGAGMALVTAAVEMARAKEIKILPLCPFAHSVFRKHQELKDVWA